MGRKPKYRRAKRRSPLLLLQRQSRKLYGIGYLKYLEQENIITSRNSFYARYRNRTLPDSVADSISKALDVESESWYSGCKVSDRVIKEHLEFDVLNQLLWKYQKKHTSDHYG